MGDFNINLFNYDSHTETNDFLNLMISHYLLPHILHPTRVTDHSATIIDNIFSNNCEMDTVSGNLLSQISDHFPQFLITSLLTTELLLFFNMIILNSMNPLLLMTLMN